MKQPAVYIMANKPNATLYVGITSDLIKRTYLYRNGLLDGFTKKYTRQASERLIFEIFNDDMEGYARALINHMVLDPLM
jgi:putative endonuclease